MKVRALYLLFFSGLYASLVFIPNFVSDMGATSLQMGIVVSLFAVTFLFSAWFFGRLGDNISRSE